MSEGRAAALLLAAGGSSRFGGPKLLADLAGRPLLDHAAELIGALSRDGTLSGAVAVVGPDSAAITGIVRAHDIEPVLNPDPAEGLASSLRIGITALRSREPVPDAVLIFLADQPKVQADTVHTLLNVWRTGAEDPGGEVKPVVRPRYIHDPGTPGHPVLVTRQAWHLFEKIEGDHGLGALLRHHPELVRIIPVPGANPGMDTPADLSQS